MKKTTIINYGVGALGIKHLALPMRGTTMSVLHVLIANN